MKNKNFTMIELLMVMTIASVILGMSMRVLRPDSAAAAIKQVGGNLNVWNSKAMSDNTSYRLEFTKNEITVYDTDNKLVHTEDIISDLSFFDNNGNPTPSQTIIFDNQGCMVNLLGAKIYADTWLVRVNGFTGHVSYHEDEAESYVLNSNSP